MTTLVRWNPVREMVDVQRRMDRMFENLFGNDGTWSLNDSGARPLALDVYRDEDNYYVEAALPGFTPEQVDLSVEDNVLTITATLNQDHPAEDNVDSARSYLLRERFHGAYQRSLTLPRDVNSDGVEATYTNGVLTITLPKAEISKPKRIQVKTA
jgi:HSP20 family protein